MEIQIQQLAVKNLVSNKGQIEGVPKNPRKIDQWNLDKLIKSIEDDPEMLDLRELLVVPFERKFVVVAGNMRLEAGKKIGRQFMPCKIIPADTEPEKLRAYIIKDNNQFGEDDHDLLANEWDADELRRFGMDIPIADEADDIPEEEPIRGISKKITVECEDFSKLESLFFELQKRGYVCELK